MKYWAVMIVGLRGSNDNPIGFDAHLTVTNADTKELAISRVSDTLVRRKRRLHEDGKNDWEFVFEVKEVPVEAHDLIVELNELLEHEGFSFEEENCGDA